MRCIADLHEKRALIGSATQRRTSLKMPWGEEKQDRE